VRYRLSASSKKEGEGREEFITPSGFVADWGEKGKEKLCLCRWEREEEGELINGGKKREIFLPSISRKKDEREKLTSFSFSSGRRN